MSTSPSWHLRIPQIIELLRRLPEDAYIDRSIAEKLFRLKRSAAAALLPRLGAEWVGRQMVVRPKDLIERLAVLMRAPETVWEQSRRREVYQKIAQLQKESRARKVRIDPALSQEGHRFDDLPGIAFHEGRLEVQFANRPQLLSRLLALAKAIAQEPDRFLEEEKK